METIDIFPDPEGDGSPEPPPHDDANVVRLVPNDTQTVGHSDDAIATRFVEKHGDELRFISQWNRWLAWDGTHWKEEDTLRAFDYSRGVCREVAKNLPPEYRKAASGVASAKTVAAVERLAKADRKMAATAGQWDRDPMILACPDVTVNLHSGAAYPPMREDYCTKLAGIGPDQAMETPLWESFLMRITDGNVALIMYLQRVCGYCLTGLTSEHVLFFLYGTDANGKSVFIETIGGILGEYAVTAAMETFTETSGEHHPTELAALRGARLVSASETQSGRRWNESRIKTLTGGDKISARFMRQDFFEFRPAFKLMLCGNHKPALRNVDEAIRRRIHLVPFTVTIPPEERDQHLAEKLRVEWPGILQWMIEGCQAWQTEGLNPPQAVLDATAEYLASEDALALWIEECCTKGANDKATVKELFESWRGWCERGNEKAGGRKGFSQRLMEAGYERERIGDAGSRGFCGIGLRQATP